MGRNDSMNGNLLPLRVDGVPARLFNPIQLETVGKVSLISVLGDVSQRSFRMTLVLEQI